MSLKVQSMSGVFVAQTILASLKTVQSSKMEVGLFELLTSVTRDLIAQLMMTTSVAHTLLSALVDQLLLVLASLKIVETLQRIL